MILGDSMEQLIGQRLHNRYQIQSLLGRQVGRRTFLAHDCSSQTPVVLKLLLFGLESTWEDLKLFEREAMTLKALDHAAIPKYLDSFEIDTDLGKGFALVQSYLKARSLQAWAETGRSFSEAELRAIAAQLLEVLTYLHSHQPPVIHRDVKPSNILLGDRSGHNPGQVFLVDFGSVQTIQHSGTVTIVGTYGYMAPEQFGGRTFPTSDLYSLGATLIYLLTRVHPADLPTRNGQIQFETASQVGERFQVWLKCLVHPDRDRRFQSARLALNALNDHSLTLPIHQPISTKPADSKVSLIKTDNQLKITVPPLSLIRKLRAVYSNFWLTLLCCSPLLLGFWDIKTLWLIIPLVLWPISTIWIRSILQIFERRQLRITSEEICLTQSYLGFERRRSSPRKDIIKLERFSFAKRSMFSTLSIWAGNQCYPMGAISTSDIKKLTELELDWLAMEISDWLDLPVQTLDNSSIEPLTATNESISTAAILQIKPIYSLNLPKTQSPADAKCTLLKNDRLIEVSAPVDSSYLKLATTDCFPVLFLGAPILAIMCSIVAYNPLLVFPVILVITALGLSIRLYKDEQKFTRILLEINKNNVSVRRKHRSEESLRHLKRFPTRDISSIQIAYLSKADYRNAIYHVQLKFAKNSATQNSNSLPVGNRKFWLSRQEAYWLAYELGNWLKVPVTELEVIVERSS